MKEHSSLIALAGALLAISCFVLPWITFTSGGYRKNWETDVQSGKASGVSFRSSRPVTEQGTIIKPIPATHHKYRGYSIAFNGNLITVAFIAAIITFIYSVVLLTQRVPGKSKGVVLISSGIGLACLLLTFGQVFVISGEGIRRIGGTTYTASGSLQFAGIGTMVGFIVIIIATLNIPKLR